MTAKKDTGAWMASVQPAVYIMASRERGTLYVGVTGNLKLRVWEHRDGMVEGFTRRYGVKYLVWFEFHHDFPSAIAREKQLKKWNRAWKLELIEQGNPDWRDLWTDLL
jgi:putative endonuclease